MAISSVKKDRSPFILQHEGLLNFIQSGSWEDHIYSHQQEALLAIKRQLESTGKPNIALVVLPTGCGKTGVAVLAPYVLGSRRVLVLTPASRISEQIFGAFRSHEEEEMFLVKRGIAKKDEARDYRPHAQKITSTERILDAKGDDLLIVTAHQIGSKSRVGIEDIPRNGYDLVIVDEAHHYPAKTWKAIVDHFSGTKRIFLTATPRHKGEYILKKIKKSLVGLPENDEEYMRIDECYTLNHSNAVARGIIRGKDFYEIPLNDRFRVNKDDNSETIRLKKKMELEDANKDVAKKIVEYLKKHDEEDPHVKHQAMVLAQSVEFRNAAEEFCEHYNAVVPEVYHCKMYVGSSDKLSVLPDFQSGEIRTLVVVNKLREGYDNNRISVVAIHRNVAKESRVLFAQFVGRAIRKAHSDDPVTAVIIAHELHKQQYNYDQFDDVADEDVIIPVADDEGVIVPDH